MRCVDFLGARLPIKPKLCVRGVCTMYRGYLLKKRGIEGNNEPIVLYIVNDFRYVVLINLPQPIQQDVYGMHRTHSTHTFRFGIIYTVG